MPKKIYTYEESLQASIDYFNGDDLAATVFVDKYALRDNDGNILEKTPEDMHWRLANEFARIEKDKFKNPLSAQDIFNLFDRFKYILCQGSPMAAIGNNYQIQSLSNCFLLNAPLDSYTSILMTDEQLVNVSKRRGGCGIDLSNLRPAGSSTRNAARTSTGIISWMERYSHSIREVGQNARRGALMLTLSVHHPEILEFATIKNDDTKVTGANISVRLSDEFLTALQNNEEYQLRFPINSKKPKISKMVNARDVWKTIINSAWLRAEPGLLNWDQVQRMTPADCYDEYKSRGTNPCCISLLSNAKIKTNNGIKNLTEVTSKDKIWDFLNNEWKENSGFFYEGEHPVTEIEFENGYKIKVTSNHTFPILGIELGEIFYFKQTKDLNIGEEICTDNGDFVKIKNVQYIGIEPVGCINVPNFGCFVLDNGIISGNSEINLSELDSCRLMCLNLFSYIKNPFTKNAEFDFILFKQHSKICQRLMDDLVDLESEKIQQIINKVKSDPESDYIKQREIDMWEKISRFNKEGRRTGTGITALGDCIAALGLKYASKKSIEITEEIFKTLKLGCYESSIDMAKELGPFKCWDQEKEKNNEFLLRIKDEDPNLYERMKKQGRRNISLTTCAPTGSVSILTQTTSGIEPLFKVEPYTRRKKINHDDKNTRVDFVDQSGDKWQEFDVYHPKVKLWMDITNKKDIKDSPWYGACAEDIDWINRVKLQSVAQRHICHGISSTINLPSDVDEKTISKIYETAFKEGLKGITVYRKGCRSGVLIDNKANENEISYHDAPPRPDELPCDIHHTSVRGTPYFVIIGKLKDKPYEIFAGRNGILDKNVKTGKIVRKLKPRHYKAILDDGTELSPVTIACNTEEESWTRTISTMLRHGIKIEYLAEQIGKIEGDMSSFTKAIVRILKKYIPDGTNVKEKCKNCESEELVYQEGCLTCRSCGNSKCS